MIRTARTGFAAPGEAIGPRRSGLVLSELPVLQERPAMRAVVSEFRSPRGEPESFRAGTGNCVQHCGRPQQRDTGDIT